MPALPPRVMITGSAGNLGRKLIAALTSPGMCESIVALDLAASDLGSAGARVRPVAGDLADRRDRRWLDALAGVDAVVHLAARNPYPDASWDDAAVSFDMTANLVDAAASAGVRRLVFASSNHVMGGYKDTDIADRPGALTTALPPWPGTRLRSGGPGADSTAYATAKLMGERVCAAKAAGADGFTTVSLRIGWCQPGDNRPETISASGTPLSGRDAADDEALRDLNWFRRMWLSNRDLVGVVRAALSADASAWPAPGITVNAMSGNAGAPWDLTATAAWIGYVPEDDLSRHLPG